jgi:L-rhamnose mutarotase
MKRCAFKMNLSSGNVAEYKKRHDEIWPELVEELRKAGVQNYSIYYDEDTQTLFAFQEQTSDSTAESLPDSEIVKKWWAYMNDGIMEYNDQGQPLAVELREVFHMD